MKKKIFIIFFIFFIGITISSFVSAELIGTFKKDSQMQIINYCSTNDCTYANLTSLTYPNGTTFYPSWEMTKNGESYNYSYTPSILGTFKFVTCSDPNSVSVCESDSFDVTPYGDQSLGESRGGLISTGIIVIFGMSIIFFVIFLFSKLPDQFRWAFFVLAFLMLVVSLNLFTNTIYNQGQESNIYKIFDGITGLFTYAFYFIVGILFIFFVWKILAGMGDKKRMQQAKDTGNFDVTKDNRSLI